VPDSVTIRYPRRVLLRAILRVGGRALLAIFARMTITGRENLPKNGPVILVGNHVAMLEVGLMVIYSRTQVEMIGTGDIPLDPLFMPIINTYGMIPINRGSMDRDSLNMALDVLKQNGVLGIFPEGGIWEASLKQGRTGVAWLSHKANAPIVPIGFGGIEGALGAIFKLKRPRLTINIGQMMPPVSIEPGKARKQVLEDAANEVMARIEALIPEEDKRKHDQILDERFEFTAAIHDSGGAAVDLPDQPQIVHPEALGHFFHRPVLLNTMARNLKLPVQPLQQLDTEHDPGAMADATQSILGYLDENPHFLTYRFGYEVGGAMKDGLIEMRDLARWAKQSGYQVTLKAIRRYRRPDSDEEIVETIGG
jgi:1-acyl-sn-glycerol-3-phosphate acyltransferase